MIKELELKELLGDLESDRIERTISTTNTDKFAQAVCAFANDLPGYRRPPGYLIVAVEDTGHPEGIATEARRTQKKETPLSRRRASDAIASGVIWEL